MNVLTIFSAVIVPIFVLIGVGVVMDKRFRLDIPTLAKLNFYIFTPALLFVKLLEADTGVGQMGRLCGIAATHGVLMYLLGYAVFSMRSMRESRTVLALGSAFPNCGNYGIPLTILAFGDQYVGPLAILVVTQNFLAFTAGVWIFEQEKGFSFRVILGFLRIPVVWAVFGALAIRYFDVKLPPQIDKPMQYLSDGLIPVALLTLGAQLSRSFGAANAKALSLLTILRLAVAPALAALLVLLFGFDGTLAKMIIVVTGLPVAVNVYVLAAEYRRSEQLASQAVFWTTLLSAGTVAILLALVGR